MIKRLTNGLSGAKTFKRLFLVNWGGANVVFPCGAVINALVIVAGSSVGLLVGSRLPERLQTLIFQLFGLCLLAIGLKMTLGDTNILIVILSAVLGAATGELFRLSQRLDALAERLKKKVNSQNPLFSQGLVSGSVMVCAGAMALVGSFEEGLGLGRTTVFAKTMIDFFATLILASRTGAGVIFASVAVLVYQGGLTILAAFLSPLLGPAINCLQSVGGLLVMAIGLNMLGLRPAINISNSLPAILFAAFLPLLMETLGV